MTEVHGGVGVNPHNQTNQVPTENDDLVRLIKRAEQGDRAVLPELRKLLATNQALWPSYGDLAAQAEAAIIQLAAGNNLLMGECLQRKLRDMKNELSGQSSSPLDRLLVERATATWLVVNYFTALAAQSAGSSEARTRMIQQQLDGANRRHLATLRTLATIRRLLTPPPSPIQIATKLDRVSRPPHRIREGVAGTVGVNN